MFIVGEKNGHLQVMTDLFHINCMYKSVRIHTGMYFSIYLHKKRLYSFMFTLNVLES